MKRALLLTATGSLFIILFFAAACGGASGDLTTAPAPSATAPSPTALPGSPLLPGADGSTLIAIPGGTFSMGSHAGDDPRTYEYPAHDVTLEDFSIYASEVTNAMYAACVRAGACSPLSPQPGSPSEYYPDPAYGYKPVTGVDYNMATEYCAWAGGRLPTEAEWEYAASGGQEIAFPWGDDAPVCEKANYLGCADPAVPLAVGSLEAGASPFGLLDMAGNAWEWVFDWYAPDAYANPKPAGPTSGEYKVVRGGAYDSDLHQLTVTRRQAADPYTAYANTGFRCVIAPPLALPDDQQFPAPDRHTLPLNPTPVDGIDPEDPAGTPSLTLLPNDPGCPDERGRLHFTAVLESTEKISTLSITLNGKDYTCDPPSPESGWVHCYGRVPAAEGSAFYSGMLCAGLQQGGQHCFSVILPVPAACGDGATPASLQASAGCGADSIVPLTLTFSPDITWYAVSGSPAPDCSYAGPGVLTCSVPGINHDQQYSLALNGTYNGQDYTWNPLLFLQADCTDEVEPGEAFLDHWPACSAGPQLAVRSFIPGSFPVERVPPGAVTLDGSPLICWQVPGDVASLCALDPDLAGQALLASICAGETCDEFIFNVPDCSRQEQDYGLSTEFQCNQAGLQLQLIYHPAAPDELSGVSADDTLLDCTPDPGGNSFSCTGIDEGSGAVHLHIQYAGGGSQDLTPIRPVCGQAGTDQVQHWFACDPELPGETYRFTTMIVPPQTITGVRLDGAALDCFVLQSGSITCTGIPGSEGELAPFEVCYENGTCVTYAMTFPACAP